MTKAISIQSLPVHLQGVSALTGSQDQILSEAEVQTAINRLSGADSAKVSQLNQVLSLIQSQGVNLQEDATTDFQSTTGWQNHTTPSTTASPSGRSVMGTLLQHMQTADEPDLLKKTGSPNSVTDTFKLYGEDRIMENGGYVEMPLRAGEPLHVIEVKYSDPRKTEDIEFYYREKGSWQWEPVAGRDLQAILDNPAMEVRKEPDAGKPWINATRVKFEVVDADGDVLWSKKKTVDPNVELRSLRGGRYAEKDNVNKTWDALPDWPMPEGATLRVTALADPRPGETHGGHALELEYVQPVYVPRHSERQTVFSSHGWQDPPAEGFPVDANREISAMVITWTDHAKPYSGSLSLETPDGPYNTPRSNVGSGEDKFFILEGKQVVDGRIKLNAPRGVQIKKVEVLYQ